jgi:uncharacterized membrane protein (UPF0127 family)
MPWLVRNDTPLVSAEVARSARARRRGLLGRDRIDGVLVLPGCRQVHTIGMRFPLDVAWCARDGRVLRAGRLEAWRLSRVVLRAHFVVEAQAGMLDQWQITVGDILEVTND